MLEMNTTEEVFAQGAKHESAAYSMTQNPNERVVRFMNEHSGISEDLFWCEDTRRVYIRQKCDEEHVRWVTANKWQGGYEASCAMRAGLIMRVVDRSGNILFEENIVKMSGYGSTVAEKVGLFSWEAVAALSADICRKYHLSNYNEWKAWVLANRPIGNRVYEDNWLFGDVEYGGCEQLARFSLLGKPVCATRQESRHKSTGKTWVCYEIKDAKLEMTIALCGFSY